MNYRKIFLVLLVGIGTLIQVTVVAKSLNSCKKLDLDLVFIGNSITQGSKLDYPEQDAAPVVAARYLRLKTGISSVSYVNQGRSGFTSVDFLPPAPDFSKVVDAAKQLHSNPAHLLIFSIKLGTNDSAIEGPNGAPVSKEAYQQNIKAIVDELLVRFPRSIIVLQQPIWYSPNTQNHSKYLKEGLARLQTYFPALRQLVKDYAKTNKNQVFMGDQDGFAYFRKNYLTDLVAEKGKQGIFYLHPNIKGATKLGELWGESIYKVIK